MSKKSRKNHENNEIYIHDLDSYSSGMHSKLAFSITAILETDIMLIDEVLSVGDAKFKKKSYAKMKELISKDDRTVLIVSHNSDTIKKLCDGLGITLGEFFSTPEFDALEQEIK